jgi:hypothetical protein
MVAYTTDHISILDQSQTVLSFSLSSCMSLFVKQWLALMGMPYHCRLRTVSIRRRSKLRLQRLQIDILIGLISV